MTPIIKMITPILQRVKSVALVVIIIIVHGCQKNVNIIVPTAPSQIVVEGYIENGQHPYVMLTRTAPFIGTIDSAQLAQYIVLNATVSVSNGTTTDTLKLTLDPTLPVPLAYETNNMIGAENNYYSLKIVVHDTVITATTKLTKVIPLDSVWFKVNGDLDTLGFVWARLTDPDTLGNYYRWLAKRLGRDSSFIAPQGSVFNDILINGKTFDFAYNRGTQTNSTAPDDLNDEKGYFKKGQTIVVKFSSIDRGTFDFWRSEETQVGTNGNPFAAPAPIKSNVKGGLGIWGGYAAFYDTVLAK